MKKHYDLVVVIPVGPNSNEDFIKDTINSIRFYCQCTLKIILLDDSKQNLGYLIKIQFTETDVIINRKRSGLAGGLYISLSHAYKHAIKNYQFNSLLKLDTDALIIGLNPQHDAEKMFRNNPKIGIAGLHKTRTEAYSFNTHLDNEWPRKHLIRATCTWRIIKRPVGNLALRKYFFKALVNGYELGENIFGGAYFINERLLQNLDEAGLLPDNRLSNSRLGEDHLFSLLAKVVRFDMGDLASDDLPFACAWKTLPASPEELHKNRKKVIHSTRNWENMNEQEIRQYFKNIRDGSAVA